MYSKAEILSLRQKQTNISDQQYDRIKELGIAKRRRGLRAGTHTRKEIKVNITYRDCQHRNYSNQEPRTRVLSSVPRVLRNPQLPSFLLKNPRSLRNKFDEFQTVLDDQRISVACRPTAETWLKDMPDYIMLVDGFNCQRKDRVSRDKSKGGGVAIFVCKDIKSEIPSDIKIPEKLEVLWLKLKLPTYNPEIYVASVYFPPECKLDICYKGICLQQLTDCGRVKMSLS